MDVTFKQGFQDPFLLILQCFHRFFISDNTCGEQKKNVHLLETGRRFGNVSPLRYRSRTRVPRRDPGTRPRQRMSPGKRAPKTCPAPAGTGSRYTGARAKGSKSTWPGRLFRSGSRTRAPCRSCPRCCCSS